MAVEVGLLVEIGVVAVEDGVADEAAGGTIQLQSAGQERPRCSSRSRCSRNRADSVW
jgi:hypothetical protein